MAASWSGTRLCLSALRECKSSSWNITLTHSSLETCAEMVGRMIIIAVYCLMVGHPGLVFGNDKKATVGYDTSDSQLSEQKPYTTTS